MLVLWVLILLGLIAAGFLRDSRQATNLARNIIENAKAEALADAGISRAMLGLLDGDSATAWRADGTPYRIALADGLIEVRVFDEGGKVNLNRTPAPILMGLFEAVGLDSDQARALVDAIHDFQDADHERGVAGAEDPDYLAAGREAGAKDAPFDDTEELMQVLGMTREIHDAISPYITVHSRRSRINLLTASDLVLRAIPNMKPEQLEKILADRSTRPLNRVRIDVVTVRAEAVTHAGGAFTREAVLSRSGDAERPFIVVAWRQSSRPASTLTGAGTANQ